MESAELLSIIKANTMSVTDTIRGGYHNEGILFGLLWSSEVFLFPLAEPLHLLIEKSF